MESWSVGRVFWSMLSTLVHPVLQRVFSTERPARYFYDVLIML